MNKDDFLGFISACIGIVLGTGLLCFVWFFLVIEIPRMRNEPLAQQEYNRCLQKVADADQYTQKTTDPGQSCQYVFKGGKL
jgi:hypothetical protein